jgi:hypothetical protein
VALLCGPRELESLIDVVAHGVERPMYVGAQLDGQGAAEIDRHFGTSANVATLQA